MRQNRKRSRLMITAICAALTLCVIFILADQNFKPVILSMAEARARALAVEAINGAVAKVIRDKQLYSELIEVIRDNDGQIAGLQTNAMRMNDLASRIVLQVQSDLKNIGEQGISIPLGAAVGNQMLQGKGPDINVRVVPVGSVTTDFQTEFESAGINQTRHTIYLCAQMTVQLVIPTGARTVEVTASVPVAETIIVGKVPAAYYNLEGEQRLNLVPD